MPTYDAHKNFAYTTVTVAPSPAASGTSLTVTDATVFPATPFNITICPIGAQPTNANAEILRVTNIAGNVLTVSRSQEGSAARTILVGDQVAATITAKTLTDVEAKTVTMPGSSVDNTLPRFDSTTGRVLQGSGVVVDDSNNVSGIVNLIATLVRSNGGSLIIGDGTAGNKRIIADNGDANLPEIRYNDSGNVWQVSNNGTVFDDIVGKTFAQTLQSKILGTGTGVTLGSDATGDIYYRNGSGLLTRLGIGGSNAYLGVSGGLPAWITGYGSVSLVWNETPSGSVNGSNTAFTTAQGYIAGSLRVYRDGQLMKPGSGNDYTETTPASGTFAFAVAPVTGTNIIVEYQTAASTTGNADTVDSYHANATPTANNIPVLDSTANLPYKDGFNPAGETWTYSSYDATVKTGVVTVASGATSRYGVGMKVKFSQTTDGVKCGIITAVASTSLTIYLGTDYDLDNETITSPFFSTQRAPLGFPMDPAKWTVTFTDSTNRTQASPTAGTYYNLGTAKITVPIGAWYVGYKVFALATLTGAVTTANYVAVGTILSTGNNTATETETRCRAAANNSLEIDQTFHAEYRKTVSVKTDLFLNTFTDLSGQNGIFNNNNTVPLQLWATCAYL